MTVKLDIFLLFLRHTTYYHMYIRQSIDIILTPSSILIQSAWLFGYRKNTESELATHNSRTMSRSEKLRPACCLVAAGLISSKPATAFELWASLNELRNRNFFLLLFLSGSLQSFDSYLGAFSFLKTPTQSKPVFPTRRQRRIIYSH